MISQSKSNRYPENLDVTAITRGIVPRALSLLLSLELVCSGLVFSAVAVSVPAQAAESEKSEQAESVAPSWNDSKSDSMFIIDSDPVKKAKPEIKVEEKAELKPEIKVEEKAEVKPEVKVEEKAEVKPEVKVEEKAEVKPEVKVEEKAEVKPDANGKAIAEVTPVAPATAGTADSAVITSGRKTTESTASSTATPAASEEALVIDSDAKPEVKEAAGIAPASATAADPSAAAVTSGA
ncbi:MAG: hypothetical protein QG574_2547, partial [Cyanobacteriota bacterium erpe_2018_sw_21hr_WHONDRS-SW48-000092_B_bin.40]|nr:hypothetical protein [Cyanobacteriota bacterium erpe_2018_sw_21hr_WHONDRS-SW48-000092_B_bin.40]